MHDLINYWFTCHSLPKTLFFSCGFTSDLFGEISKHPSWISRTGPTEPWGLGKSSLKCPKSDSHGCYWSKLWKSRRNFSCLFPYTHLQLLVWCPCSSLSPMFIDQMSSFPLPLECASADTDAAHAATGPTDSRFHSKQPVLISPPQLSQPRYQMESLAVTSLQSNNDLDWNGVTLRKALSHCAGDCQSLTHLFSSNRPEEETPSSSPIRKWRCRKVQNPARVTGRGGGCVASGQACVARKPREETVQLKREQETWEMLQMVQRHVLTGPQSPEQLVRTQFQLCPPQPLQPWAGLGISSIKWEKSPCLAHRIVTRIARVNTCEVLRSMPTKCCQLIVIAAGIYYLFLN